MKKICHLLWTGSSIKIVSLYDQEIPQSQTADNTELQYQKNSPYLTEVQ